MHCTSSAVVVTLLMAIFTSSPVNSQETLTLVDFGDFSNGGDGRISASIQRLVPVGTANGGSLTTFSFEEVDAFSTTDSNGSPTTYTATEKVTVIGVTGGPPTHTQLIPIASPSQSAGNSALGHSSNGIVIVGIAVGTLLGFMRVF